MTEHSSIYTASNPPRSGSELEPPGPRMRRSRAQPYANLADEVLETLLNELRTPLAVMTGWSRMLQQQYADHADEFLRRGLSQLTRYTSAQSALLARAGDFCDLRTGRAALNREHVDLFDLAGVALRAQQATALQRGVQQAATFETPEGAVLGDYARLRQIIADLLATALEATRVGHRLQVHGAVTSQFVVLSLHDAGETAERRVSARTHDDAHPVDDEQLDRRRLTLALARGLVALHGGVLTATPGPHDTGVLTTLRLPRCGASVVHEGATLACIGEEH